jgi:hypothetical protein
VIAVVHVGGGDLGHKMRIRNSGESHYLNIGFVFLAPLLT